MLRTMLRKVRYSFEVRLDTGKPISERHLQKFGTFVSDQLLRWSIGIDDAPFEEIVYPTLVIPPSDPYWLARMLFSWMQSNDRALETVRDLLPELGSTRAIRPIAEAVGFNSCLCLLSEQLERIKAKAERYVKHGQGQIAKMAAASAFKRLLSVESQLLTILGETDSAQTYGVGQPQTNSQNKGNAVRKVVVVKSLQDIPRLVAAQISATRPNKIYFGGDPDS